MTGSGYAICIDTLHDCSVPVVMDETGQAVVFATEREAQLEIADLMITRLQEFIDGQREFEDAMTVEEYVVEVAAFGNRGGGRDHRQKPSSD